MDDEQVHYGVRVREEGSVRVVTLDRPERRNALDLEIRPVLAGILEAADADESVRAIVVTGSGGAFCSGGDVSIMERMPPERVRPRLEAAQRIVRAIAGGRTPVIAAVEGVAFAAGLGLALACDRIVAAADARFSAAFTGVGLAADLGVTWSLPHRVGTARARQMMMLGGLIGADEALAIDLVDSVVPSGAALDAALADARRFVAGPPRALASLERAFTDPAGDLDTALNREIEMQAALADTDDYAEGIAAFHEKRKPRFAGA
jgi:2-(1,2-epoxy-1,2-dihydrophenyl)acetyl-CoA isomerase